MNILGQITPQACVDIVCYLVNNKFRIDTLSATRFIGKNEISVEFCIGDMCVGLWDERKELMLDSKISCKSLKEVKAAIRHCEKHLKSVQK